MPAATVPIRSATTYHSTTVIFVTRDPAPPPDGTEPKVGAATSDDPADTSTSSIATVVTVVAPDCTSGAAGADGATNDGLPDVEPDGDEDVAGSLAVESDAKEPDDPDDVATEPVTSGGANDSWNATAPLAGFTRMPTRPDAPSAKGSSAVHVPSSARVSGAPADSH